MELSRSKRRKTDVCKKGNSWRYDLEQKRSSSSSGIIRDSDPFAIANLLKELDSGRYGIMTGEIHELVRRREELMRTFYAVNPRLASEGLDAQNCSPRDADGETDPDIAGMEVDHERNDLAVVMFDPVAQSSKSSRDVVVIDSDDEDDNALSLNSSSGKFLMKDVLDWNFNKKTPRTGASFKRAAREKRVEVQTKTKPAETIKPADAKLAEAKPAEAKLAEAKPAEAKLAESKPAETKPAETQLAETKLAEAKLTEAKVTEASLTEANIEDEDDGTDDENPEDSGDDLSETKSDGLGDIWNEMTVALECSKDDLTANPLDDYCAEYEEDCEHSFILKDDIGDVCRICGVIRRGIESIIEFNFSKSARSTSTYSKDEARSFRELDQNDLTEELKLYDSDFSAAEIHPHPRHRKEMKPHQFEGFNFLVSNLVTDNPGGCIMAHAPGSGKTFMIISFLQSFMAKYPAARPLVVLPRGILPIWKKEFLRWQVEDIPLYDFYSVKADGRSLQLEVLKGWVKERSILFLGYKQFSSIVCDTNEDSNDWHAAVACQNYLLKVPAILILDEGHTPRNQDTDVLTSLERVETPRKVVLSGTLYQNHVEEVFNILNLVRPKFLKMEHSKAVKRSIMSKMEIPSSTKLSKNKLGREHQFYELIERTLIKDSNPKRKVAVIESLREMTRRVLHYYKGDNLDELPGLTDFSVFLRLSPRQEFEIKELKKTSLRKFAISAQGSAIYVHPKLKDLAKQCGAKDRVDEVKINAIIEKLNVKEGAKLNFYMNLLQLCESSGEKMLVFSQYLLPLKFLERFTAKVKGYGVGREMFMITGDSDNETREYSMERFNTSAEARVFFGSIRACGEGISLVGASRIVILDVHLNPSVTRQAIGRAFRPGQVRKVYTYRLIAFESPEEEDHLTCYRKETIAKMWFEWEECGGHEKLEMKAVDVDDCGDDFLEMPRMKEGIVSVTSR